MTEQEIEDVYARRQAEIAALERWIRVAEPPRWLVLGCMVVAGCAGVVCLAQWVLG